MSKTGPPTDPPTSDEDFARLLGEAGHRPPVPEMTTALVKRAARDEWQRTVQARRRRASRWRGGAGLLAAAAVLLAVVALNESLDLWRFEPPATSAVAQLVAATGPVRTAEGTELRLGDEIAAGAVVETAAAPDSPARAVLQLRGGAPSAGATVRLDVGTRLRLVSGSELALDRGAVYVDSGVAGGAPLAVRTPLGAARDVGTLFEVRLLDGDGALRVRVREGRVRLERDGAAQELDVELGVGDELTVQADGTLVHATVPLYGRDWAWVVGTLPPFDAAGRTLREFLEWAVREGGWELRFADPALAERAAATVLYASVTGRSLEDGAAAVLAASDLGYRLEGGVFLVVPAGG